VLESSESFIHEEHYSATLEIGFSEGIRANAEICSLQFEDTIFDLAQYIESEQVFDDEPHEPEPF